MWRLRECAGLSTVLEEIQTCEEFFSGWEEFNQGLNGRVPFEDMERVTSVFDSVHVFALGQGVCQ